jgi:ABC-type transport system involved in multi-copper enzyme maturation permease subunit
MIRLVRVELLKLTTTRSGYVLLGTAAGLTIVFSILEASLAGKGGTYSPAPLYTSSGFNSIENGGVWFLLLSAVFGVMITSGEFRHRTATNTYLAAPRRNRVLTAKMATAALAGAIFGFAGFVIPLAIALGYVAADGHPVPMGDLTMAANGAGHLVAGALLTAIGAAVGALVRSQMAGTVGIFAWMVVAESLLGGLFTSARPYLPYTAATVLGGTSLGGGAFGPSHGVGGGTPLPFAAGTALLLAIALVLAGLAARTTVRRDIT